MSASSSWRRTLSKRVAVSCATDGVRGGPRCPAPLPLRVVPFDFRVPAAPFDVETGPGARGAVDAGGAADPARVLGATGRPRAGATLGSAFVRGATICRVYQRPNPLFIGPLPGGLLPA